MKKVVLRKTFTREFPLILCQIWGRRYIAFLEKKIKTIPAYVYIFKDGIAAAYRNNDLLTNEINQIIKQKISKDKKFIAELLLQYEPLITKINKYCGKPGDSKEALLEFLDNVLTFWHLSYIAQFIPEDKQFSRADRIEALNIRKKIEHIVHDSGIAIVKAIQKIYPDLKLYSCFVSLEDLETNKLTKQKLKQRAEGEIIVFNDKLINHKELKILEKQYFFTIESDDIVQTDKITGQIAWKGKVKGVVRIIRKVSDLPNFKKNEIMVASTTIPTYISAMKIASAFVTDEGGITSHAAIVAREFKKPCIVGTKIATQIFKDGDMVEVDANKGIVRKI